MSGIDGIFSPPTPVNEPVKGYAPESPERKNIKSVLSRMADEVIDLPSCIGGKWVTTQNHADVVMPHDHGHVLGRIHTADDEVIASGIQAALDARPAWAAMAWQDRAAIFLKAADLLAGSWRDVINASTMLGQSKTVHQAEIDAACELIDFWRFNVEFARRLYAEQPQSSPGVWNRMDHRGLEGFILAITPFNFTAIAGNLCTAPALVGNTVVWKAATTQALSAHYLMQLFQEAGLPDGVINLVHAPGRSVGAAALPHRDLAGVHFTGSTPTFQHIWRTIGQSIETYRSYPRIVGETGGKDFIVGHASADAQALAVAIARGSFEYQGQKCSAASRIYVSSNLWPEVKERLVAIVSEMRQGDVRDFSNFVSAVIDRRAYDKISGYVQLAHDTATVLAGGTCDDATGFYIAPTVVQVDAPDHRLMTEEIFGPLVSIFVFDENQYEETLALVDQTSPYALTGAVFAQDREVIAKTTAALRQSAGNFYINDKPSGAVVGQQPFGGARASGTNDKAGSILNLQRWVSPRSIKETFHPPHDWRYPFLG
jgi:1-pyrroline-5-carboxylate dehydrogenase